MICGPMDRHVSCELTRGRAILNTHCVSPGIILCMEGISHWQKHDQRQDLLGEEVIQLFISCSLSAAKRLHIMFVPRAGCE